MLGFEHPSHMVTHPSTDEIFEILANLKIIQILVKIKDFSNFGKN